jgi:hypothetical protein
MIETTIQSVHELFLEIWNVDRDEGAPAIAQMAGRVAERLTNLGTVLLYGVLLAYAVLTVYRLVPDHWLTNLGGLGAVKNQWWLWVGIVLVLVTALRFGLEITKLLKRWNVASLLGAVLIFDLLLKAAPPLLGLHGYSPVESILGALGSGDLANVVQKALGL